MIRIRTVYIVFVLFALAIPQRLVSQSLDFDGDQDYVNINTVAGEVSNTTDWAALSYTHLTLPTTPYV